MIIPHKERTFDSARQRTQLREIIDRHAGVLKEVPCLNNHHSVWVTEDVIELIEYMNKEGLFKPPVEIVEARDEDDKVGNGFTIVLRK